LTIQRNWQHRRRHPKQKHNTICVEHHYAQTNTNNVSETQWLLQTIGGKDESRNDRDFQFGNKSKVSSGADISTVSCYLSELTKLRMQMSL
jgi:hypothetical protein